MVSNLIKLDGVTYKVRVVYDSLVLRFSLLEGNNAGVMLSGDDFGDVLGTKYGHQLVAEPDPTHPEDYDAFLLAISAPVNKHQVELPFGQDTIAYEAKVTGGEVTFSGKLAGKNRWHGLQVNFQPVKPQRR